MKNNFIILAYNNSNSEIIFELLIINNFLIDKFLNEDNYENLRLLLKYLDFKTTLLYLYKYNNMNVELYNLFRTKFLDLSAVIALSRIFINNYCRSVKLLNYLSENFSDNKFSENFITVVLTDIGIKSFLELKHNNSPRLNIFDRYNFNYNDKFNYKVINKNENKNKEYIRLLWQNVENNKLVYKLNFYSDRDKDVYNDYLIKYNKHLIEFLLEINTYLKLMYNKITYYIWEKDPYDKDDMYAEDCIFQILKNTSNPIFNSYRY
ncbi:hypothetical protein U3516DRAFT_735104 [Neocallimastix sp. 'constans']